MLFLLPLSYQNNQTTMTKPKTIKLPLDLFKKIEAKAKKDGRTFHGYVLNLLNKAHK